MTGCEIICRSYAFFETLYVFFAQEIDKEGTVWYNILINVDMSMIRRLVLC